ncbi:ATPases with chaperone activity, ATP-binding subunit [Mesomycoplasma hyorhinis SK76]|uniref:ATPases with chaperone activity, ATP-binding subunit n=3 Tax=Mesomycoplasma hyorhinis TaxID=2100 RepID=A0AAI8ANF0_MESHY|nr:ATPases with chaperone activity, ATP-binding subunit [Mesomycoplasma hyorhinis SK76]
MFFTGPTGTGKTEISKALAEFIFGSENHLIRFDMSEYNLEHSDQKLIGAPPGYEGHEAGGQLTNAIKEKPFSIVLFDEIEKAHGRILDKFLQILEDGRLTSSKGELVDFSETFIIFTSNLGVSEVGKQGSDSSDE